MATIVRSNEELNTSIDGLNNVDNTSDADKPISTATQLELDNQAVIVDTNVVISSDGSAHAGTGSANVALGNYALRGCNGAGNCVAIGTNSLSEVNNEGWYNIAIGRSSGENVTTGDYNTFIGKGSGDTIDTGSGNVCLGKNSQASAADVDNEITLGNLDITTLRCKQTSITALSDIRDKANIVDLEVGLDFINSLRPVNYQWDVREWYEDGVSDGSKIKDNIENGFIVQEVQASISEHAEGKLEDIILTTNLDRLELKQGDLLPAMVQAIKELSEKVALLEGA